MKEFNESEKPDAAQLQEHVKKFIFLYSFATISCALLAFVCCASSISWLGFVVGYLLAVSSALFYGALAITILGAGAAPVMLIGGLMLKAGTLGYGLMKGDLSDLHFLFSAIGAFVIILPAAALIPFLKRSPSNI